MPTPLIQKTTKDFLIDGLGGNDTLTIDLSASDFQVKGSRRS